CMLSLRTLRVLPSFPTRRSSDLFVLAARRVLSHPLRHQCLTFCRFKKRSARGPCRRAMVASMPASVHVGAATVIELGAPRTGQPDRKSTRLNSSHVKNSYAVFSL